MSKRSNAIQEQYSDEELQACKHCGTDLNRSNIKKYPKKNMPERYGVYWMGIEKPYLQIYKVECSNLSCQKKYTVKVKKSSWLYK